MLQNNKLALYTILLSIGAVTSTDAIGKESKKQDNKSRPNVVIIMADDIGWGDVGCNGAEKIKTPNIDALAARGINFTNGYAPASTSTPSRYTMLSGKFAFRKNIYILPGDATMIVPEMNLASFLQDNGYNTGVVGKWHLGLGDDKIDWNSKISPSPNDIGFGYSFIIPGTGDRVPCVLLENGSVVNHDVEKGDMPIEISYKSKVGNDPTGLENPEMQKLKWVAKNHRGTIVNGIARIGWMSGGYGARWVDEELSERLTIKAEDFIESNADSSSPFFLYYATHDAHEPRIANAKHLGGSDCGIYGDVIEQFDTSVGRIIDKLKEEGVYENSIIFVLSDNGPRIKEGYEDGGLENLNGHNPYRELRGDKATIYEGGLRIPYIVSWANKIKKNRIDSRHVSFSNMLPTVASLVGLQLPSDINIDVQDESQIYLDKKAISNDIVMECYTATAIRSGSWKYIRYKNSKEELYNLADDVSESNDLISVQTEIADRLRDKLDGIMNQPE